MAENADEFWRMYLINILYELRKQKNTIKGYSDMLTFDLEALEKQDPSQSTQEAYAQLPFGKTPASALELLHRIHDAIENITELEADLDRKIHM